MISIQHNGNNQNNGSSWISSIMIMIVIMVDYDPHDYLHISSYSSSSSSCQKAVQHPVHPQTFSLRCSNVQMLARLHHGAAGDWNQMHFMGMVSFQFPSNKPQKSAAVLKMSSANDHPSASSDTNIFGWVASWQVVTLLEILRARPQALHSSSQVQVISVINITRHTLPLWLGRVTPPLTAPSPQASRRSSHEKRLLFPHLFLLCNG